jgi:hypothetical protein
MCTKTALHILHGVRCPKRLSPARCEWIAEKLFFAQSLFTRRVWHEQRHSLEQQTGLA